MIAVSDDTQAFEARTERVFPPWVLDEDSGEWRRDEPRRSPWRIGALIAGAVAFVVALGFALVLLVIEIGQRGDVW